MSKANGGHAFPHPNDSFGVPGYEGMTLRDYFAGQALSSPLFATGVVEIAAKAEKLPPTTILARAVYEIADALLAERERQP